MLPRQREPAGALLAHGKNIFLFGGERGAFSRFKDHETRASLESLRKIRRKFTRIPALDAIRNGPVIGSS